MELNKALLDCMQTLRRQLRAEQALDIRLSQADAINAMLAACLDSNNEQTRLLGQRLALLSDSPYPNEVAPPSTPSQPPTRAQLASPGSLRIYRGQRVYA